MKDLIKYEFSAKIWQHSSPGGWFFVSLPTDLSKEIREHLRFQEEGWGRMKAIAGIGKSKWESAIWFDTKLDTYLLPIKSEIRKVNGLHADQNVDLSIWI